MHMRLLLTLAPLPLLLLAQAQAACSFSPGPGNDSYVCDSGSAASLLDTVGNNSLLLPAGGSGTISGNVTFGAGQDTIDMASGVIGGDVNQGAEIDTFNMSGGIIEGDLNQGDGLDRFQMTGGWIKGNFDSGDFAQMDGGRIGNVNMRLDENTFILRLAASTGISSPASTRTMWRFSAATWAAISASAGAMTRCRSTVARLRAAC